MPFHHNPYRVERYDDYQDLNESNGPFYVHILATPAE
jgi:hypothetical protein